MSLAVLSRAALLTAASWAALAGAAAAQNAPRPAELDEVIVTGMPFGVTDRASLLAVEVLDEEDLAVAPASVAALNFVGADCPFDPYGRRYWVSGRFRTAHQITHAPPHALPMPGNPLEPPRAPSSARWRRVARCSPGG